MKKALAIILAAVLFTAVAASPAVAGGDHGWAVVGKVLTGVIGLNILGHALASPYYYPAPVYAPPPGVYYPPEQVWVPGHYETRLERRWVPGHWEVEQEGRYGGDDDYDGGRGYQARRYWVPGHYRDVEVRLWVPGHWEG